MNSTWWDRLSDRCLERAESFLLDAGLDDVKAADRFGLALDRSDEAYIFDQFETIDAPEANPRELLYQIWFDYSQTKRSRK